MRRTARSEERDAVAGPSARSVIVRDVYASRWGGSTASRSSSGSQARNTFPDEVAWRGSERPFQSGHGTPGGSTWST